MSRTRIHQRTFALPTTFALILALPGVPLCAQALADTDMSGAWKFKETAVFLPNDFGVKKGKATSLVYFRQAGTALHGMAYDKLGKCGLYEAPYEGTRNGIEFSLEAYNVIIDTSDCMAIGEMVSFIDGTLIDGVHADATGSGYAAFWFELDFNLTGTFTRVSGMQSPDDPDGPLGPAVPLALMGSGQPGTEGCHDLAITMLTAPKKVTLSATKPAVVGQVKLAIQNRGQHAEAIEDLAMLQELVAVHLHGIKQLAVKSDSSIKEPAVALHAPPATAFPIVLAPRKTLKLVFDVSFDFALDPLASTKLESHADWSVDAQVRHEALSGHLADDHAADDVAPRSVIPPWTFDCYPDGKIKDKGVGGKKPDKTLGAPVLVDVVLKS